MRVTVMLPDLARVMTGKRKKQYAWSYLQKYYPAYVPLPVQERLEEDNVLICDIDFAMQRRLTAEVNARREENKKNKTKNRRK